MPTPEYCPNCGSFDLIIHEETAEEYRWCECKTCESVWSETSDWPERWQFDDDGQRLTGNPDLPEIQGF
jgi:uncharacterized Zn finger protein